MGEKLCSSPSCNGLLAKVSTSFTEEQNGIILYGHTDKESVLSLFEMKDRELLHATGKCEGGIRAIH